MNRFYEENFDNLYNDVSILLSDIITESSIAEGWLEDLYVSNRYNTTKAIEKCAANLLLDKIINNKDNLVPIPRIIENIDRNINKLDGRLGDYESVKESFEIIKHSSSILECLKLFRLEESLEFIKEGLLDGNFKPTDFNIKDGSMKYILNILEGFKRIVRTRPVTSEEVQTIKDECSKLIYLNKFLIDDTEQVYLSVNLQKGFDISETEELTSDDIKGLFREINDRLEYQPDHIIKYVEKECRYICDLIEYNSGDKKIVKGVNICESSYPEIDSHNYGEAVETFNSLVESIFFDDSDEDIDLNEFIRLYNVTESLCEFEETMEASSKAITKGTEKVTRAIGNTSAKSRGMADAKSKLGQIKRGAKIIDDRASDAINKKLDDIMNTARDAKREKMITGKNTVRLSKALKTAILMIAAPTVAVSTIGPLKGVIATIITALARYALSKRTEEREKKRILLELETELKIVNEKIEDAKGDNAKEQKYQLIRIQANLEKEITRIKHGLRYY